VLNDGLKRGGIKLLKKLERGSIFGGNLLGTRNRLMRDDRAWYGSIVPMNLRMMFCCWGQERKTTLESEGWKEIMFETDTTLVD
jgi:hypothetical protein